MIQSCTISPPDELKEDDDSQTGGDKNQEDRGHHAPGRSQERPRLTNESKDGDDTSHKGRDELDEDADALTDTLNETKHHRHLSF